MEFLIVVNNKLKIIMTMTLELLVARVETLEKQMAVLMNDTPDNKDKPEKKEKKGKKQDKSHDHDEPCKKRVSGYNMFVKANREEAFNLLAKDSDDKPKGSEVMKKLGAMWKELDSNLQAAWNNKAKAHDA
tara:strand:+ start:239 stop:631 length:393 start_codon:yes stop_codon:yes gene_type:complete